MSEKTHMGLDKISRYKWTLVDEPGVFDYISKNELKIDHNYQRDASQQKLKDIASAWSWAACGAIVVGLRENEYWVIDGQHRVMAAQKRSDIDKLPCLVFLSTSVKDEARAFINLNVNRKPISSIAKFRAMVVSGDEVAIFVDNFFKAHGIKPKACAERRLEISSVALSLKLAGADKDKFAEVMKLVIEISGDMPLRERLIHGLWHINEKIGLSDKRLLARIKQIGGDALVVAANKAAAYYNGGGYVVWAGGMLTEINKGLQNKFEF